MTSSGKYFIHIQDRNKKLQKWGSETWLLLESDENTFVAVNLRLHFSQLTKMLLECRERGIIHYAQRSGFLYYNKATPIGKAPTSANSGRAGKFWGLRPRKRHHYHIQHLRWENDKQKILHYREWLIDVYVRLAWFSLLPSIVLSNMVPLRVLEEGYSRIVSWTFK